MNRNNHFVTGITLAVMLSCILPPLIANGEEPNVSETERKTEARKNAQTDDGVTFSDVMGWAQRFGNRVGDNISEAASKTASAIKNAASDDKQKPDSKENH